jgi:hypothetical protein
MINFLKRHWILFVALIVLWGFIAFLLISSINLNNDHFGYPLDDTYIHMSIAKNISINGVWGVDKYAFENSTSSPLWIVLLSGVYSIAGVNEYSPFIMNVIIGTLLILLIYFILLKYTVPKIIKMTALLSIIFFTPLLPLIFSGMEHVMHAFLTILFVFISVEMLSKNKFIPKYYLSLIFLSPLVATIRYEGLALIIIICGLLILRKRYVHSLLLVMVSMVPIVIYGMISLAKGWYFFPNSILLKANYPSFSISGLLNFIYLGYDKLVSNLHITTLFVIALALITYQFKIKKSFWESSIMMLAVFIFMTILHVLFAAVGMLGRYEAYLMVLGFSVITIVLCRSIPENFLGTFEKRLWPMYVSLIFMISIIFYPLLKRGYDFMLITRVAVKNNYEQQYQMGMFLKTFYQGDGVAANDIGAINYFADIRCVDLWGLSSIEVAKAKRNQTYSTREIDLITKQKNVKIAILYSKWFSSKTSLPSSWIKVGEWTISDNVICGDNTVTFYAVQSTERDRLMINLKTFSSQLPKDIVQSICQNN